MGMTLPDSPIAIVPASERTAVGNTNRPWSQEPVKVPKLVDTRAKYKIEVHFGKRRSSLAHKPSPVIVLIWESGKQLHGGGDDQMCWCGYDNCGKPISSSDYGYFHVVCRHCQRELFLDHDSKRKHIADLQKRGIALNNIDKIPCTVPERLANLTPSKLADLVEKTWYQLNGEADVYFKYSPYEIRFDALHETTQDLNRLEKVRRDRKPGIYLLKDILKDTSGGATLHSLFLAMIVA
jgi:hypothetical protein